MEIPHYKSEEYAHVWMIVQGHHCPFLYEEEYQPIIIIIRASYRNLVQVFSKVIRVVLAFNAQLLGGDSAHFRH